MNIAKWTKLVQNAKYCVIAVLLHYEKGKNIEMPKYIVVASGCLGSKEKWIYEAQGIVRTVKLSYIGRYMQLSICQNLCKFVT